MLYTHLPLDSRSTPIQSRKITVTRPLNANVARKANASITPPNCASTPDAATTTWRSSPSGSPDATAQASSPPSIAPARAVATDS